MGRHSVAYLAAQQGLSTDTTAMGTAKFVGRVGALAFAMGVGAAVAGGAGIANADDTGTSSASDSPGGAVGSLGAKLHKALSGGAGSLTGHLPESSKDAPADSDSPVSLITKLPNRIATQISNGFTDASPSTSFGGTRSAAHFGSRANPTPTAAPFVNQVVDDTSAALRGSADPLGGVQANVQPSVQQGVTASLFTATAPVTITRFAAPTTAAAFSGAPIATVATGFLSVIGFAPTAGTGLPIVPTSPTPVFLGALQLLRRETDPTDYASINAMTQAEAAASAAQGSNPATTTDPQPGDTVNTPYGQIGKWMLQSDGSISNYGGQPSADGREQLEPVNVIIVDPTSKTPEESEAKLNRAMTLSGFPAQPVHSGGFMGKINNTIYDQMPSGLLEGYSDNLFIFPNDHGRIFGPAPLAGANGGYVYSGAFSTEQLGTFMGLPTHTYVSSDMARDALALRLILSGQATYGGMVKMDNAVDTDGQTTGDDDGYAVVLILK